MLRNSNFATHEMALLPIPVTEAHFARPHEEETDNPKSKDDNSGIRGVVNNKIGGVI
jgi:hypothetical protein